MITIHTERNVKIAVYDLNPSSKKVIVLIHGWPLSEKIFEYQKRPLVSAGYRVITLDLRGFGNSDTPAAGYGYDQLASDLHHVIRELRLPSFTLVGFSMGGGIATRYMGLYGSYNVKRLCLLGAASPSFTKRTDFPYGVTRESVDDLIDLAKMDRPQLCEDFSKMLLNTPHSNAVKDWFKDIALTASGIGTIECAYSLRDEDCRPDLTKIKVPTGIFHGKKDQIVPYELALVQHEVIKNSQLFSFEESGHGVFYDDLDEFNHKFLLYLESTKI